jgi:beta-lactam-binding protein with PASTA domain
LTSVRLRLGTIDDRPSERPAGTIVDQAPDPGTVVRSDTTVQVWIAVPMPAIVPDLSGQDRARATDALIAARLRVGEIGERPSEHATGTVVDQQPPAGSRVASETVVQLWLAAPVLVSVPDLTGQPRGEAERTLSQLGLGAGAVAEEASPAPAGTVVRQRPVPGVQLRRGEAVELVFARTATTVPESQVPPIRVPDLSGRSEAEARVALETAGLRAGVVNRVRSAVATAGTIVGQSPGAGATVAPGAAVDLAVAEAETLGFLWMLAGVALGLAAAGVAARVKSRGRLPRGVTFAPHADAGVQFAVSTSAGPGPAAAELSLQGFPDRGVQTLQGPLPPIDTLHAR